MPKAASALTSTFQEEKLTAPIQERADEFIKILGLLIAQRELLWHAPTTSYDENDKSIEISWWRSSKALIVTVEQDSPITFLKVWGPNIHNEMDGGEIPPADQLVALWQWLYA